MSKRTTYSVLILIGFLMMESPIVLFANKIEPIVLGMPFLVFWTLFWWLFCTIVFLIAYQTNWGRK